MKLFSFSCFRIDCDSVISWMKLILRIKSVLPLGIVIYQIGFKKKRGGGGGKILGSIQVTIYDEGEEEK